MKLSLFAFASALLVAPVAAEEVKTLFQWAFWCCLDSNEMCGDACAFINDCDIQAQTGMLTNGMTGSCREYTLEALNARAVDTVNGPFGPVTIAGVPALCRANTPFRCCDAGDGFACGDPHFKTWGGLDYDYQGQCDLKFISAPKFGRGLGLDIHIRTDIKNNYSYISAAAIKIGDNVLEIGGWGEYILNGVEGLPEGKDIDASFPIDSMGDDIPIHYEMKSKKTHVFTIDVGQVAGDADAKIKIQTFREWVSIHLDYPHREDYADSVGMLGSFPEGRRLARDGKTIMEDDNEFGQEWQVLPAESGLFQGDREPQFPRQCVLPDNALNTHRHLSEAKVTKEQAKAACAHLFAHQEFCVRDVLATQDLGMANMEAF